MNSKNLAFLGFLGAMMASSQYPGEGKRSNNEAIRPNPKKVIPKGCKEYFFTKTGSIYTTKPQAYEVVFECIASSEKAAHKKFDKWYR